MPGDLLRYVGGPTPYSPWWLWLGFALLVLVFAWYAVVVVATMPADRLRRITVLRGVHARLLRLRFGRVVRRIAARRRRGELSDTQAYAEISRTVRTFLQQATGVPARYLQVDDLGGAGLAPAGPLLVALREARFDAAATADPDRLGAQAEELIRSWT